MTCRFDLPGYDDWKTRAPEDDEQPELCGVCGYPVRGGKCKCDGSQKGSNNVIADHYANKHPDNA